MKALFRDKQRCATGPMLKNPCVDSAIKRSGPEVLNENVDSSA